jgi:hypothetical protein
MAAGSPAMPATPVTALLAAAITNAGQDCQTTLPTGIRPGLQRWLVSRHQQRIAQQDADDHALLHRR